MVSRFSSGRFNHSPFLGFGGGRRSVTSASIGLNNNFVSEGAEVDDVIGLLSVSNGTGTYTFTITSDPDSKFKIENDNELQVENLLDYETDSFHLVTIEADNGVDDPISRVFTINVVDVVTPEPLIIELIPADNEVDVAVGTTQLTAVFSQQIDFGAVVLVRLYATVGTVLVQTWTEADIDDGISILGGGAALIMDLDAALDHEKAYHVLIASASVKSVEGSVSGPDFAGITLPTTWNFTTVAEEDLAPTLPFLGF